LGQRPADVRGRSTDAELTGWDASGYQLSRARRHHQATDGDAARSDIRDAAKRRSLLAHVKKESGMETKPIKLYFDYKSPFAYLAKDEAYQLEEDYQ